MSEEEEGGRPLEELDEGVFFGSPCLNTSFFFGSSFSQMRTFLPPIILTLYFLGFEYSWSLKGSFLKDINAVGGVQVVGGGGVRRTRWVQAVTVDGGG